MSRDLTIAFKDELVAETSSPCFFFEAEFTSTTLRYWTGQGSKTWDGNTWAGDYILDISPTNEEAELSALGLKVAVAGEPEVLLSIALGQLDRTKKGRIWFGFLDSSGAVIADPHLFFEGNLDILKLEDSVNTSKLTISYENKAINLSRPKEFRYNSQSQQNFYSSDLGFEYVPQLADWQGYWGKNWNGAK